MARRGYTSASPERTFCVDANKEKACFSSEAKARKYARSIHSNYGTMTAYYCKLCDCWHLTHYSKGVSASIGERKRQIDDFIDLYSSFAIKKD